MSAKSFQHTYAHILTLISTGKFIGIFDLPIEVLKDPGVYGIRSPNMKEVMKLEEEIMLSPTTGSTIMTAMIDARSTFPGAPNMTADMLLAFDFFCAIW